MKITTFKHLTLLASLTFLTACSSTIPKPDTKTLSTLAIIGVDTTRITDIPKRVESNLLEELPMARTYPMLEQHIPFSYTRHPYVENNLMLVSNIEENAKNLLGIKYVWGATGPATYDCSGFTQKIYRDAGISIPRVSRDQARVGQFISYSNLERGDMVFFDTKKKRSGKVSHVGIYLGDGDFIHASSAAKKVVIYNFDNKSFYKKRFLWGRRVIKDNYFMASI